jgi:hypothetical protein
MSVERAHLNGLASSAALSYAGWLASQVGMGGSAPDTIVPIATPRAAASSGSRNASGRSGGAGSKLNRRDLAVRPPVNTNVPNKIPRNFSSQITWFIVKTRNPVTLSTSSVTEFNVNVSLANHPQASSLTVIFDQWSIPFMSTTTYSLMPPGSLGTVPELHSALDLDNSTNLGSAVVIDAFNTSSVDALPPGKQVTRSCRPCVKTDAPGVGGAYVSRMWCDSSQSATPWYGIRHLFPNPTQTTSVIIEVTWWLAFRNTI